MKSSGPAFSSCDVLTVYPYRVNGVLSAHIPNLCHLFALRIHSTRRQRSRDKKDHRHPAVIERGFSLAVIEGLAEDELVCCGEHHGCLSVLGRAIGSKVELQCRWMKGDRAASSVGLISV